MVSHTCQKCGKIFDKKSTYVYHIGRKLSCIPESNKIDTMDTKLKLQDVQIKELQEQMVQLLSKDIKKKFSEREQSE